MDIYLKRPEFAIPGGFKNFPNRLRSARAHVLEKTRRAEADNEALIEDRRLFPGPVGHWHGSEAQSLLKVDIDKGKHLVLKPNELYTSREEYQQFSLQCFRGHIYQEINSRKYKGQYNRGKAHITGSNVGNNK